MSGLIYFFLKAATPPANLFIKMVLKIWNIKASVVQLFNYIGAPPLTFSNAARSKEAESWYSWAYILGLYREYIRGHLRYKALCDLFSLQMLISQPQGQIQSPINLREYYSLV